MMGSGKVRSIERKPMTLLLIGPLLPPIGGDTQLFSRLAEDLRSNHGLVIRVASTSRGNKNNDLFANIGTALRVIAALLRDSNRSDLISYHASPRGISRFGPIVYVLASLFNKPLVIRVFGGSFEDFYRSRGKLGKWILERTVLSADLCLLETQLLVRFFKDISPENVEWFSNYTWLPPEDKIPNTEPRRQTCERLVFLGHMWKSKGIETILRSVPYLPSGVKIDLFGPLDEYMAEDINCRGSQCVRYRGILTQREVMTRLWDYDALVLPTSHAGEGYPGVILEAFSHGLPVITTRWMSIPEIVDESCGILIETESVEEFVAAVTRLHSDPMLFARLGEGARNKSQQFDSTWWTEQFIRFCDRAISKRKVSAA